VLQYSVHGRYVFVYQCVLGMCVKIVSIEKSGTESSCVNYNETLPQQLQLKVLRIHQLPLLFIYLCSIFITKGFAHGFQFY